MKAAKFAALAKGMSKKQSEMRERHRAENEALCERHLKEQKASQPDYEATGFVMDWVERHLHREVFNANFGGKEISFDDNGVYVRLESEDFFNMDTVTIPYRVFTNVEDRKVFVQAFKRGLITR